jgi:hypothetical protein
MMFSWIMYLELNQNMTLNEIIPTFIVTRWSRTDVWDLYEQADSRFMVFPFFFLWQTHFIWLLRLFVHDEVLYTPYSVDTRAN